MTSGMRTHRRCRFSNWVSCSHRGCHLYVILDVDSQTSCHFSNECHLHVINRQNSHTRVNLLLFLGRWVEVPPYFRRPHLGRPAWSRTGRRVRGSPPTSCGLWLAPLRVLLVGLRAPRGSRPLALSPLVRRQYEGPDCSSTYRNRSTSLRQQVGKSVSEHPGERAMTTRQTVKALPGKRLAFPR